MTHKEAVRRIQRFLAEEFGKILTLKEVSMQTKGSVRIWRGTSVCTLKDLDIEVGTVAVDETGAILERISLEDLVTALKKDGETFQESRFDGEYCAQTKGESSLKENNGDSSWQNELAIELGEEPSDIPFHTGANGCDDMDSLWEHVEDLLNQGEKDSLERARELLPHLLAEPDSRGAVLSQMAWVEHELGEGALSLDYLQAAAREFSDSADLESLELLCRKAEDILGEDEYGKSIFHRLLRETKTRTEPIDELFEIPFLSGLEDSVLNDVENLAELIEIDPDTDLLLQGEPSLNVFFVKNGRLTVRLNAPDGAPKTIAVLLPGDLIGESSVMSDESAFCNATVHAETKSFLWRIVGSSMKALFNDENRLKDRITQAREFRKIHSFLSLHPSVGELETLSRQGLMGCIDGIVMKKGGQVLIPAGKPPSAAYIIASGAIEQRIRGRAIRLYGADDFIGFRDTLHGISSECEFVVLDESGLIVFNADRLRKLGLDSPPNVSAVLERLG